MGRTETQLGELELEVLKVIWKYQPCTVQEVYEAIGRRRDCARTTILTVIQRLHAKKFLKRHKKGGVFRYVTTAARGKVISNLIRQFVDTVLDGSAEPFVAYLAESEELSRNEAAALRRIARKLEEKSPEE